MTAPIDYNAVLSDLEARRAGYVASLGQIDAAIAVIRAMLGAPNTNPEGAASGNPSTGEEGLTPPLPISPGTVRAGAAPLQSDTFFGLTTPAAVKKFMNMVKRPQTPRAIAEALQAGGQVHATDEKTAYTNVYTALRRGKEFVQTRSGDWGLAEWYGNKPKTGEDQ